MRTVPSILVLATVATFAHENTPDPILFYNFTRKHLVETEEDAPGPVAARLKPQFGPELLLGSKPLEENAGARGLRFAAAVAPHRLDGTAEMVASHRPVRDFTISSWFTLDVPKSYGAVYASISDDGGHEKGLALGYRGDHPAVALATKGADDGDGKMTYLVADERLTPGMWHHVVATYDGTELRLFLDGRAVAGSREQQGEILWPEDPATWIGGYRDSNENFPHEGRLANVKVFGLCANANWVAHEFERGKALRDHPGEQPPGEDPAVIVEPYLQWVREDEATVMWETNFACKGILRFGKTSDCPVEIVEDSPTRIHQITVKGLEPEMLYYYTTLSDTPAGSLESEPASFQTMPRAGSPFAFVVLCDTQANPQVVKQLAEAAWEFRPNFVLIGGDLVTTGTNKSHWTKHFFPHMRPLINRVPVFPVLGNHEQNATYYYDYMKLPEPEYWYTFTQGEVQFFMLDSNKDMREDSEQYRWLDRELAASRATWKIAMHHHPPYSSDDDYRNDWKSPVSAMTFGEPRVRPVVKLYDKHAVDLVWNGHIHSYERTWMMRGGKPVEKNGTTYLITGGGGGGLERFGPYRPAFQRHVKTGHHLTYVTAFGGELDFKAYDLDGRLFDRFTLTKSRP